ncbi:hypothetical protein [Paraburkholderia heleia]|uniref:hypothetical protein n=1 Tax=Paraburkholderia heleia TaxID=634127 RepID=UPI002AB79767|nr:hypothetical protein [Paraburkholderia heleia]
MEENKKPVIYLYRSPFGAMTIRPNLDRPNAWALVFEAATFASNGERTVQLTVLPYGWTSPEAAAEAVRTQQTGWRLWDTLPFVVFPASLEDWTQLDSYGTVTIPPAVPSE